MSATDRALGNLLDILGVFTLFGGPFVVFALVADMCSRTSARDEQRAHDKAMHDLELARAREENAAKSRHDMEMQSVELTRARVGRAVVVTKTALP